MKHFLLGQGLFLKYKNGRVFFNRLYKNIYILFEWVSIKYLNTSRKYEGNMSLGGRQCMKLQNEILWSYKNMFCYLCLMVAKLCLQFEHCFEADYCIVKGNYYFRLSFQSQRVLRSIIINIKTTVLGKHLSICHIQIKFKRLQRINII